MQGEKMINDITDGSGGINDNLDQSYHSVNFNIGELEKDCMEYNSHNKSETNTHNIVELPPLFEEQYLQDCNSTERLQKYCKEKNLISFKLDGEKYFPHFKAKVISYALKHSIKNAALTFKVNKDTVSNWVHQSKQSSSLNKTKFTPLTYCQVGPGPGEKFIDWLNNFEQDIIFSREIVTSKANEFVTIFEKQEPNKINLWFSLYTKRLNDDKTSNKIKINYPNSFKHAIVNLTKRFSKKRISLIFNVDRKRICEWTNDFKSGKFKERDVSKYLTDPEVDRKIWEWYCVQKNKPTGKEVRLKAAHLYKEAGYHIRCSPGWYYRWRVRHHLPPVRMSQALRDSELLAWILIQMDENKSIAHADLLKQASLFKASDFKASSSWVFRFVKKYISHIQSGSQSIILPNKLEEQVQDFRKLISSTVLKRQISPENVIAFDEVPVNFCSLETTNESIVGKSDWANCQASLILSCSSDGTLLPSALILRDQFECAQTSDVILPVLVQDSCVNDEITIKKWFKQIIRYCERPSTFICDCYEPHKQLKQNLIENTYNQNIELMIIPGGCSSHLQPILFGLSKRFKVEINKYFQRWHHDSNLSGMLKTRSPSNVEIYNWVLKAHNAIFSSCKDLIKMSFVKAGISNETKPV